MPEGTATAFSAPWEAFAPFSIPLPPSWISLLTLWKTVVCGPWKWIKGKRISSPFKKSAKANSSCISMCQIVNNELNRSIRSTQQIGEHTETLKRMGPWAMPHPSAVSKLPGHSIYLLPGKEGQWWWHTPMLTSQSPLTRFSHLIIKPKHLPHDRKGILAVFLKIIIIILIDKLNR